MRAALALVAGLALVPAAGRADGFLTHDLGDGGTLEACMDRASGSLENWFRNRGVPDGLVQRSSWSVQGYDVPPNDVQVQIVCPSRDDEVIVALLFSYSLGPEEDREVATEGIRAIWARLQDAPLSK